MSTGIHKIWEGKVTSYIIWEVIVYLSYLQVFLYVRCVFVVYPSILYVAHCSICMFDVICFLYFLTFNIHLDVLYCFVFVSCICLQSFVLWLRYLVGFSPSDCYIYFFVRSLLLVYIFYIPIHYIVQLPCQKCSY
jgi:hypothetical protein